ncbi:alkaline shock response membrane anchor protein AmaP [Streptococcus mitis]|uniref:alkaline shock response membrane anchor protein AmaP n=1 Tax=Streptococcus mitis TaxID=28037 RepID=UPI001913B83A|nr:alkaline shock response membrane anchor protein AmaP [Streptococcus mitis]QQQ35766.1 alkaline shock response membrane anchor protein AmaP [Streptococcus mitis]
MSKAKKICFIIFCILILTIFLPVLIDYHQVSDLGIQLFSWRQNHFVEFYLSRYIFWGIVALSTLVLLSMLVVLFYPKRYLEIQLKTKNDTLKLKNSAIEGFVRSLVSDHGLIKNPTVHVNLRKNKCFVHVEGKILPSDNIADRCQLIQNEITNGLKQFFGIERQVKLEVLVKDYQPKPKPQNKKTVSRVK